MLTRLAPDQHGLSMREPGGNPRLDQRFPVVSHDGCRLTYAYFEPRTTGDDALAATILLGDGAPAFHAGHQLLVTSSDRLQQNPVLASSGEMGGPRGPHFFACDQIVGTGDTDVVGAIHHGTTDTLGVRNVRTAYA